ncbi:type II secretion system F family protein [Endozoicomonas sp. G2_2]|uniref:type II secretion system F family protein n=1 Tax=Endozoicomonas sp. G2_2 TaxID=2821092 RepID=UPI001ADA9D0E|nr:type II secretion system F family protein [Endozoicomonas sp. G2_2]
MFEFKGYNGRGAVVSHLVEARNADEARPLCPFPPARFISGPRRTLLAGLHRELTKTRLTEEFQAMFLAQLGGAIMSGQSANKTFLRLMSENRNLKKEIPRVQNEMLVSRRLELLEFDFQAVLLAQIGESTSTLGEALLNANETLLWRRDLLADLKRGLFGSVALIGISICLLCGIALFMTPTIRDFTGGGGLEITLNFATYVLFAINDFLRGFWWLLAGAIGGVFALRKSIARRLSDMPGLDSIFEYFKLQRGMRFLTAYKPLFDVGVSHRVALEQLAKASGGDDKRIYQQMLAQMKRDNSPLSVLLDHPSMPQIIRSGFVGFEGNDNATQQQVMRTQLRLCQSRARMKVTMIKRVLTTGGFVLVITAILLMAVGGYLALASMQPSMGM